MRRLFWVAVGASVGVLMVRKVQRTVRAYTPAALTERAQGLGASIRAFTDEVRAGMAERELELRGVLGLDVPPALTGSRGSRATATTAATTAAGTAAGAAPVEHPTSLGRGTG